MAARPVVRALGAVLALLVSAPAAAAVGGAVRPPGGPVATVDSTGPVATVPPVSARQGSARQGSAPQEPPGQAPSRVGGTVKSRRGWVWPLDPAPQVAARFDPGPYRWSPGHRGVDLLATPGQLVRAAAPGVVSFVGVIAGRGVVAVTHPSGVRTTYEPVAATVRMGDLVAAGSPIGTVAGSPGHCSPRTCLHWGALHGQDYLDPLMLLGVIRPVLLPWG